MIRVFASPLIPVARPTHPVGMRAWSAIFFWWLAGVTSGCSSERQVAHYPWHEAPFADTAIQNCKHPETCSTACYDGDSERCEALAYLYETGEGVAQNYPKAADLYGRACDGQRGESCARLGVMYDIGLSVTENVPRARELYRKACDLGGQWSCRRISELK